MSSNYVLADVPEPPRKPRERYWLHALLLLLTFFTTTTVGARLAYNFDRNRPAFLEEDMTGVLSGLAHTLTHPLDLWYGLPFSLTLLTILMAHEMGHYITCRYYKIDASLPYFLPAPSLIGTLGAFIRIRSAIYYKRQLFDVGIAGPIAGFVFVIPALAIGLAFSKVIPGIAAQGDLVFSAPGILRFLEALIFPGVPVADIYLHPIARAAWVGIFATALNLLPIGQLDGGHILYAFIGERHRLLSRIFVAALVPMGYFSVSWLFWAVLLFFFGMKHPRIYDSAEMGSGRTRLGWLALAMFLVCFSLSPISTPD
ncbi:MAG: site-2 protease family protein [Bryobacteraceae bacterium]